MSDASIDRRTLLAAGVTIGAGALNGLTVNAAAAKTSIGAGGGTPLDNAPHQDSAGSCGTTLVGFQQTGSGATARAVQDKLGERVHFFDFASPTQRSSITAYDRSAHDMSAAFDAAVTFTFSAASNHVRGLELPAGVIVGPISWPSAGTADTRDGGFRLKGVGRAEAFAPPPNQKGTVFYSADTSRPSLVFRKVRGGLGSGALDLGDFRVEGNQHAGVPALKFEALFGSSRATGIDAYQAGDGDGVVINNAATGSFDFGYALNSDWNTSGLGASRTGVGFFLDPDLDCGLAQVTKTTSRGWKVGYRIGEQGGSARLLATRIAHFECSVVNDGVVISDTAEGTVLDSGYWEGVDNAAVIDRGEYTTVIAPYMPMSPKGLDLSDSLNTGTNVYGGVVSTPSTGGVAIDLNAASGMKSLWGISIVNPYAFKAGNTAIGLRIAGSNPRGFLFADFPQQGSWVGTAKKISDVSTSPDHPRVATGGLIGAGPYEAQDGRTHYSWDRGALRLHVDPVVITEANVSGGALSLPAGSVYILRFSTPTTISSLVCERHPDKTLILINNNGNVTFQNSAQLLLRERTGNYTAPTAGSVHLFQAIPGTQRVMQELFRTGNAPRTAVNAAAAPSGANLGDSIYMSGAGKPAWWNGKSWQYADGTAAA
ncbi:MAG: hypothetical protein MT490_14955 [Sphingomonas sp.]|uniref:hypothetical protein n=1 Tax=Sphingomonas sp. TaxID=28214 RepID=UPI002272A78D|nr:hypothetical protein [Sphingomonas sp.]MCX8477086.1 hypothetical protein [Sphingomonas sp.]